MVCSIQIDFWHDWSLFGSGTHQKAAKHSKNTHEAVGETPHAADILDMRNPVEDPETPPDAIPISSSVAKSVLAHSPTANPPEEARNKKAVTVINRVRDKLTGRDFDPNITLDVPQQVDLLIQQATSHENLCQCYIGWCPFW